MSLDQFKQWALSLGQVGNPVGNTYIGQCVSLVQQYLYQVYKIPFTPRGDAKDWATNANVLSHFDKVNTIQPGDIIIYPGTFGGGYGHIAIALGNGQMLDQNGDNNLRVAIRPVWNGYSTILRRKGTPVATDIWAALDQSNKDRDKQINDLKTEISKLYVQLDNTNKRLDAAEKKLAEQTPPGSLDGLYEIKKKG